jgi:hypothetical protein
VRNQIDGSKGGSRLDLVRNSQCDVLKTLKLMSLVGSLTCYSYCGQRRVMIYHDDRHGVLRRRTPDLPGDLTVLADLRKKAEPQLSSPPKLKVTNLCCIRST